VVVVLRVPLRTTTPARIDASYQRLIFTEVSRQIQLQKHRINS